MTKKKLYTRQAPHYHSSLLDRNHFLPQHLQVYTVIEHFLESIRKYVEINCYKDKRSQLVHKCIYVIIITIKIATKRSMALLELKNIYSIVEMSTRVSEL